MPDTNSWKNGESDKFLKTIEDIVDDLINICQPKLEEHLLHLSLELLHGIKTVLPPPSVTKYGIPDPISEENWKRVKACGKKERKCYSGFLMGQKGAYN